MFMSHAQRELTDPLSPKPAMLHLKNEIILLTSLYAIVVSEFNRIAIDILEIASPSKDSQN